MAFFFLHNYMGTIFRSSSVRIMEPFLLFLISIVASGLKVVAPLITSIPASSASLLLDTTFFTLFFESVTSICV